MSSQFSVSTHSSTEMVNITSQVQNELKHAAIKTAVCTVYVPPTTAGLTINEGADPAVVRDMVM